MTRTANGFEIRETGSRTNPQSSPKCELLRGFYFFGIFEPGRQRVSQRIGGISAIIVRIEHLRTAFFSIIQYYDVTVVLMLDGRSCSSLPNTRRI